MNGIIEKREKFESIFEKNEEVISTSPGRINLIGEHTDYNGGWVLPAAIDKNSIVLLAKNDLSIIRAYAFDLDEHLEYSPDEIPKHQGWNSYIIGVIEEVRKVKKIEGGFDILIGGNVPFGAGLSSSASIECALAYGINELFHLDISKEKLAKICQAAEHHYVGVKCGIMDQYASMMGKSGYALYLDCKTIQHQYIPIDLGEYAFLLCNTNVSHSLASSEYNTRREQCEQGVQILQKYHPNIQYLRDVDEALLKRHRQEIPDIIYQRCLYVVQENDRVNNAISVLECNDLEKLGELMYASHAGLSKMYEVSCPELDFLVEATFEHPSILGSRMMGGGFGGCTLNLIHKDTIDDFIKDVQPRYQREFGKEFSPYIAHIGDGARIINF